MCWRMEFTNGGKSVGKVFEAEGRQRRELLLQLGDALLEVNAVLAVNIISATMPMKGEIRGQSRAHAIVDVGEASKT